MLVFVTLALVVVRLSHLCIASFQLSLLILEFRFMREQFLLILPVFKDIVLLFRNLIQHPLNALYILSAKLNSVGVSTLTFQFVTFLTFKHLLALSYILLTFFSFCLLLTAKLIKSFLQSLDSTIIFAICRTKVLLTFSFLLLASSRFTLLIQSCIVVCTSSLFTLICDLLLLLLL